MQLQTTPAMRDRLRELSNVNGKDDYDRVVLLLLDDFEALKIYTISLRAGLRLCEDEGCPQFGTDHECVEKS